jgi:hypothetical protein
MSSQRRRSLSSDAAHADSLQLIDLASMSFGSTLVVGASPASSLPVQLQIDPAQLSTSSKAI